MHLFEIIEKKCKKSPSKNDFYGLLETQSLVTCAETVELARPFFKKFKIP